jgi:hypothetical protein
MADERIRNSDTSRTVARLREAYERDPVKSAALKPATENYPADYDPTQTPTVRRGRQAHSEVQR